MSTAREIAAFERGKVSYRTLKRNAKPACCDDVKAHRYPRTGYWYVSDDGRWHCWQCDGRQDGSPNCWQRAGDPV